MQGHKALHSFRQGGELVALVECHSEVHIEPLTVRHQLERLERRVLKGHKLLDVLRSVLGDGSYGTAITCSDAGHLSCASQE